MSTCPFALRRMTMNRVWASACDWLTPMEEHCQACGAHWAFRSARQSNEGMHPPWLVLPALIRTRSVLSSLPRMDKELEQG